jgi:hypothetical protein
MRRKQWAYGGNAQQSPGEATQVKLEIILAEKGGDINRDLGPI